MLYLPSRDVLTEDPNRNRKSLVSADKRGTQHTGRESELKNPGLEKQAQMMRAAIPDDANLGSKSVQSLLAEQIKFTLNAAVDI